ncbi:hypothetical protein D8B26_003502 [Coccidioides posadasii str. Silveira]|uniref:Uncharacterized protein n=1 Tax=Coccidioides posadasii (strain RMSCC 757 / Silveira) TaxID=443226 RepID=E9D124_COCPS|nr:hypothetical protein CPSG_03203 [Coccidioides posadasii str. Silveira]QVM08827.1 hypothetical protein D8B26_003502 [Coccidioides posadasii str. Silveira]
MSRTPASTSSLQTLRQRYQTALHNFTASSKPFGVLDTITPPLPPSTKPVTLFVLDSSFNPPTRAHLRIAKSALLSRHHNDLSTSRLLLLLATQNADKPSKPALFEDRLVMMSMFAHDLQDAILSTVATDDVGNTGYMSPPIDIGVTKLPYFIHKAVAISSSGTYPADLEQVHLTGYDTLVRIFDPKYYPPEHTLGPLAPFLKQHRLRVTLRPDDEWGGSEEQRRFLVDLASGTMERIGGKREWAERIEIVEGTKEGEEVVSSTKARREAGKGNGEALGNLVTNRVRDWVLAEAPYRDG